ncbi:beta-ketoacyl synthase N-terminal-like domain-containing protein [Streptomyces rimosus]|uniref:beta-ketoacyl synthase N-terminal-like domain-containing protein n=1 Tax=Streptomyces rimosus TaxID=1927 RepID=UPI0037D44879
MPSCWWRSAGSSGPGSVRVPTTTRSGWCRRGLRDDEGGVVAPDRADEYSGTAAGEGARDDADTSAARPPSRRTASPDSSAVSLRVSDALGLRGPSVTLGTGQSSSLVARRRRLHRRGVGGAVAKHRLDRRACTRAVTPGLPSTGGTVVSQGLRGRHRRKPVPVAGIVHRSRDLSGAIAPGALNRVRPANRAQDGGLAAAPHRIASSRAHCSLRSRSRQLLGGPQQPRVTPVPQKDRNVLRIDPAHGADLRRRGKRYTSRVHPAQPPVYGAGFSSRPPVPQPSRPQGWADHSPAPQPGGCVVHRSETVTGW